MPRTPFPPENFNIFRNPPPKSFFVRTWVHNVSSFYFLKWKIIGLFLIIFMHGTGDCPMLWIFFKSNLFTHDRRCNLIFQFGFCESADWSLVGSLSHLHTRYIGLVNYMDVFTRLIKQAWRCWTHYTLIF